MTLTRARTIQYVGILFSLMLIAAGYWYWSARAGVKTNTSASQSQGTGQLDSGLAGYWTLDETTGSSANDASTNGNTGTLTNMENGDWITGQIGNGLDFDGTNEYVEIGSSLKVSNSDRGAITAWVKFDSWTDTDAFLDSILGYGSQAASSAGKLSFEQRYFTSAHYLAIEQSVDGGGADIIRGSTQLALSTWYHVAVVSDGSAYRLYLNGAEEAPTVVSGSNTGDWFSDTTLNETNDHTVIGGRWVNGAFSDALDGQLDEVRVYNRTLSADEVGQLYRLTTPTATDTYLNGYWSFNAQDMSGTTAYDRSGAGNTGTLTGGPTGASGIVGQALNFDGTDDYVTVPDNSALDVPSNFLTLSGWFNRDTATTDDVILAKRNGVAAANAGYIVYLDATTDKLVFEMSDGTDEFSLTSTTTFTTPGWHHFAITYEDDVNSTTQIYIDGLVNQATKSGVITDIGDITNALAFVVGAESDAGSPFDGKIDEIRMYQGIVLPAARIKTLFDQAAPDEKNTSGVQAAGVGRLESGLTAYWPLDDGTSGASPTTAADASTNSLAAGTLTNGPVWAAGQIGSSVDFDGTDDYIAVADTPLLDFGDTDDFTLAGWFNRESYTTDDVLVAKRTTLLAGANGYVAYLDDATDQIIFEVSDGTDEYSLTSVSTFSAASKVDWHHFTIVWDQDSPAQSEIYIDGVADNATDSGTIGNVGDLSNSVQFGIGVNSLAGDDYDGKIDEVRVYSRALSADEIVVLYRQATPTGVDTGLEGYWSFDSEATPGTIAFDRSGARNTGTLVNGPTKTSGIASQAINLDGTNDYVNVGSASGIDDLVDLSTCAWVYPEALPDTYKSIIGQMNNGGAESTFGFFSAAADPRLTYYRTFSGAPGEWDAPIGAVPTNAWSHVCMTYNKSSASNDPVFYINGVPTPVTERATPSGTASTTGGGDYFIGALDDGGSGTEFLDGKIDEVRLYSRILSAGEIKALYDAVAPDKSNTSVSQPQGTGRLDSGLLGYWKLDETSGSSAADASAGGNNGTLTNMENADWTSARIGNGLTFDGTNEYVTMGDINAIDGLTQLTVSAWAKSSSLTTQRTIVSKAGCNGLTDSGPFEMSSGYSGDARPEFLVYPSGGTPATYYQVFGADDIDDGNWHHLTATYDGAFLKMYVDGVLSGTVAAPGGDLASVSVPLEIGRCPGASDYYWNNMIDEVRIYNRALSADEVGQLYSVTTPTGTDTSLKGYWSFNGQDISGTIAYDRSGAGNNGTLTTGPTAVIGRVGQALNVVAATSYVTVPDSASLSPTSAMTFSFWLRPTGTISGSEKILVTKSAVNQRTFYIASTSAGAVKLYLASTIGDSGSNYGVSPDGVLVLNQWTHITTVFDGAGTGNAGRAKIYINGSEQPVIYTGTIAATIPDSTSSLNIGSNLTATYDEVRFYSRALTTSEIMGLYNSSK